MCTLALAACGGSEAAPDASIPDAEVHDAAACHSEENVATVDVIEVGVDQAPPTPTGGSIVDGTYVITAAVIYSGVGGQTGESGVVYRATSYSEAGVYRYIDEGTARVVTTGAYQTSGVDGVQVVQQCPNLAPLGFDHVSASPTEFTLFAPLDPTATQALTFTLQP